MPGFRDMALMLSLLKDQLCYAVNGLYILRLSVREVVQKLDEFEGAFVFEEGAV